MDWIISRLLQASTIRAVIQLGGSMGLWSISESLEAQIVALVLAGVGLVNLIVNEKKAAEKAATKAVAQVLAPDADRPWLSEAERQAYEAGLEAGQQFN